MKRLREGVGAAREAMLVGGQTAKIRWAAGINALDALLAPVEPTPWAAETRGSASSQETLPLATIFSDWQTGDEHPWEVETHTLVGMHWDRLQSLRESIAAEGIKEPIRLGNDGRVWDGHHRIVVAHSLGLTEVPVEPTPDATTNPAPVLQRGGDEATGVAASGAPVEPTPGATITLGLRAAVNEAYTTEGADAFWRNWQEHPEKRARMRSGVLSEWSGQIPGHLVEEEGCRS